MRGPRLPWGLSARLARPPRCRPCPCCSFTLACRSSGICSPEVSRLNTDRRDANSGAEAVRLSAMEFKARCSHASRLTTILPPRLTDPQECAPELQRPAVRMRPRGRYVLPRTRPEFGALGQPAHRQAGQFLSAP